MDIEQLGKLFEAMTKASNRLETTADNQQGMFQATAGALNDSFAAFKLSQKATLDELKTQHAQYYDMHVTQQLMISELQDMRTSTNSTFSAVMSELKDMRTSSNAMFAAVMREVKDLHAKQYELQLSTVNAFDELHGKMQKTDEALQRSQQEFHASQQEFRAGLQEMMRSFQASQQIIFNTLTQSPHSEMAPRQ